MDDDVRLKGPERRGSPSSGRCLCPASLSVPATGPQDVSVRRSSRPPLGGRWSSPLAADDFPAWLP